MTAEAPPVASLQAHRPFPVRLGPKGSLVYKLVTTTDHKLIGIMYVITCYVLFFAGGLMALLMRTELAAPGLQFLSNEQYNQLLTMHGTIMLLLYAAPIVFGFANLVLPLQIGAPDVAFPRLNAFSFWLFALGAMIVIAGFITPGGAADFGWTGYPPLSSAIHSPGAGADAYRSLSVGPYAKREIDPGLRRVQLYDVSWFTVVDQTRSDSDSHSGIGHVVNLRVNGEDGLNCRVMSTVNSCDHTRWNKADRIMGSGQSWSAPITSAIGAPAGFMSRSAASSVGSNKPLCRNPARNLTFCS